jgi:hypothetical protein
MRIRILDSLTDDDPEEAHGRADDIAVAMLPPRVAKAWVEASERCGFWYA